MNDNDFQEFARRVESAVNNALAAFVPNVEDTDIDEKLQAIVAVLFTVAIWRLALMQKPGADMRADVAKIADQTITENAALLESAKGTIWKDTQAGAMRKSP